MGFLRAPLTGALLGSTMGLPACETRTVVPVAVASVEIVPATLTLVEGEARTAEAVARGPGGVELSGRAIAWATDTEEVARVDASGTVEAVGTGETTLRATVEGVTGSAPVTVLPGPSVELSRTALSLRAVAGGPSGSEIVQVTNGGSGILSGLSVRVTYAPEGPTAWLTAGLGGTTAPVDLSISASAASLEPGSYEATVTVEATGGGGDLAADLSVELVVEPPPPTIVLEVEEVAFGAVQGGGVPAVQVVLISNGGGGVLEGLTSSVAYQDGEPTGWLGAVLTAPVAPTSLTLEASPGSIDPGTYHAVVEVASEGASNSPRTLTVEFTVAPAGGDDR